METKRELEKLKKRLTKKFLNRRLGEHAEEESLQKFFKPVVSTLAAGAKQPIVTQPSKTTIQTQTSQPSKSTIQTQTFQSAKRDLSDEDIDEYDYSEAGSNWTPTEPLREKAEVESPTPILNLNQSKYSTPPSEKVPVADYAATSCGPNVSPALSATARASRISTPPVIPPFVTLKSLESLLPNQVLGQTAQYYMLKFFENPRETDPIFGLQHNMRTGELTVGNKPVKIFENDIVIEGNKYLGRSDLWKLLVFKDLKQTPYAPDAKASYANILTSTNAIYQNNDPATKKPKSSGGQKYKTIIAPIWEDLKPRKKTGKGMTKNATACQVDYRYYDDPNDLVERLRLLYRSALAGHDGHRNEMVEILSELEDRGIVTRREKNNAYQNLGLE